MSETLKTALVEIFWLVVPLVIGYLVNTLRQSRSMNIRKKLLRITGTVDEVGKTWLKFIPANPQLEDAAELVTCGYVFEYRAAGELGSTLNKLYGPNLKIQTTMSKSTFSYSHADLSSNLILIGGPFHNSVTREFLAKMGTSWPFRFEEDASLVYTGSSEKEKFTPKVIDDKYYGDDYALIMNIKNPYNPEKRVIFIAGCRSIGCYGGAIFLSQQLKELRKRVPWDEYALVVSCSGDENDLKERPQLKAVYPLNIEFQL